LDVVKTYIIGNVCSGVMERAKFELCAVHVFLAAASVSCAAWSTFNTHRRTYTAPQETDGHNDILPSLSVCVRVCACCGVRLVIGRTDRYTRQ